MRALRFDAVDSLRVVDVPEPVPGPGEVVVDVAYAGICGSDLHGIHEGGFRVPPLIMGHEFSAIAPDGMRVTINATVSCGTCDRCLAGLEQVCRRRTIIGIDRQGGLAERVAVPEEALVELPEDASLEAGAMVEPLAVGLRAWKRSRAEPGMDVAIIGGGNVGLMILTVGAPSGVEITVVDINPRRLEVAEGAGATNVTTALESEYDVIYDAVGSMQTRAASIEHLRPGGSAIWLGCHGPALPQYNPLDMIRSERSVMTSFAYTRNEFVEAAGLTTTLDLGWATVVDLEDSPEVFLDLSFGRSPLTKALIRP